MKKAVFVLSSQVARVEPTLPQHLGGGFGPLEVPVEKVRPLQGQLANLPLCDRLTVLIPKNGLSVEHGLADGRGAGFGGV